MKTRTFGEAMCLAIILIGVLFSNINATAATSAQTTALEKKLYEAAKKEGKVEYWDSQTLKEAVIFTKAFNNRYPGIEVSTWEGSAENTDAKYFAEHQAGRTTVDVKVIEGYSRYGGHLMDLSDIIKDTDFPKELCPKNLDAVALSHNVKGSIYNTKLVPPQDVPRSWEDFLDPKWKGKIAVDNGLDIFIYLTKAWGKEGVITFLEKLRVQKPLLTDGVTQTTNLLAAGEYPIAMGMNLFRVLDMQSRGSPIAWVPLSPAVVRNSPYVIIRNAPHPNAAKLYLRWLMGPEGQSLMDKIRRKGNPLPGSGTVQSKAIEQLGIKLLFVPPWGDLDFYGLREVYQKAIGFITSMSP